MNVRRRAFTLTEMLVSLAVIIIVLAIVTTVFGVAAKTTAVSQAISEIQIALDAVTRDLEDDLSAIKPDKSILAIVGRNQAACRTEAERQARRQWRILTGDPTLVSGDFDPSGPAVLQNVQALAQYSDPRADILICYPERPTASRVPALVGQSPLSPTQLALQNGAKMSPVQVVWGHAALADAIPTNGGDYVISNIRHIQAVANSANWDEQVSPLPLTDWILARRCVIIEPIIARNNGEIYMSAAAGAGAHYNVMTQVAPYFEPRGAYPVQASYRAADSAAIDYRAFMAEFDPTYGPRRLNPLPLSRKALASPYRWRLGAGSFNEGAVTDRMPYLPDINGRPSLDPVFDQVFADIDVDGDGRAERDYHHFATVIKNPPAQFKTNLALQRLAGCAWFQVEFLMPEDPRNDWSHPDGKLASDTPRWVSVPSGETYVFVPDSDTNRALVRAQLEDITPGAAPQFTDYRPWANSRLSQFAPVFQPTGSNRPLPEDLRVRLWPYAIRITIRVFDPKNRFADPIVRTIEHRFP